MVRLDSKLSLVVGDRTAKVLSEELGINLLSDLLRHYPRRYVVRGELSDFESIKDGEEVTILARIKSTKVKRIPGRKSGILEVEVSDGKSSLLLTFFNQAWRAKDLVEGREGLFAGKIGRYKNKRQLAHPDYLLIPEGNDVQSAISEFAGKYLPVYSATRKLPSWKISQCVSLALANVEKLAEPIPKGILNRFRFPELDQAIRDVHQPENLEAAEKAKARLTFDEALIMQLFLLLRKSELQSIEGKARLNSGGELLKKFDQNLPFELTSGQKAVWEEIRKDLGRSNPMYRLLQGDVGSGKTIVALRAMLSIADSGGQAALLAPTEVLAQQHYKNFSAILGSLSGKGLLTDSAEQSTVQIELLTGSTSSAERKLILEELRTGEVDILIGTHSLLNEEVKFNDLALVVIDEQHRFGVEQRDVLRNKSEYPPHVLVMTATPIPRTVAMTVFGDLDISTLKELPLGRTPIESHVVNSNAQPKFLERAWQRVREEVAAGNQVYVVAPKISPSDDSDFSTFGLTADEMARARKLIGEDNEEVSTSKGITYSVEELFPKLRDEILKGIRVGMLHGRMSPVEKEDVMNAFQRHEIDVLVSTTVIEVGVDVPNASMIMILSSERFGVSQLHQLRGRVGRGQIPGLCLFVTSLPSEDAALTRLNAVAGTTNGFELSRLDLEQRREGDVLGSAQSGATSHLRLLRVIRDEEIIVEARMVAEEILKLDPMLSSNAVLLAEVDKLRQEERASYLEKK
jgi:ATP-dependent DNA helicase RecG